MDGQRTVPTSGGALSVRLRGEGPHVLLLHGIPGSAAIWDGVAHGLAAAGFTVVVPDLLGFGGSARPKDIEGLSIATQAASLCELLTALDVEPTYVAAHDYGVPIAVTLAHRLPEAVSGLVLAAGNVFTDTPVPLPLRTMNLPVLGGALAWLALSGPSQRGLLRLGVGRPRVPLDKQSYLGDHQQSRAIATIFTASLRDLPGRYATVEAALPALTQPTVVLWGDRDPFFPPEQGRRVARAIQEADLQLQPDAGHFLPTERPMAFLDAITQIDNHIRGRSTEVPS